MNILCRLGLHSWDPIFGYLWYRISKDTGKAFRLPVPDMIQIGLQCRRCGKRVAL